MREGGVTERGWSMGFQVVSDACFRQQSTFLSQAGFPVVDYFRLESWLIQNQERRKTRS